MIAGQLRSKVDKLWTTFWSNGVSNPLSVIEQISYLPFIKRLDDLELARERKALRLGGEVKGRIFAPEQHRLWTEAEWEYAIASYKLVHGWVKYRLKASLKVPRPLSEKQSTK